MASYRMKWNPGVRLAVRVAAAQGLKQAAGHVLSASAKRVPVDTGELRDSGSTGVEGLRGFVSYDDSKAVAAHENMRVRYEGGRQAKFLDEALNAEKEVAVRIVARWVKAAL